MFYLNRVLGFINLIIFVFSLFYVFKDCVLNSFKKVGPPICTEANIEHMEQQIDKAVLDAMNLACGDYQESDQCTKYTAKFDKSPPTERWKTPFPAIIEVLESII